MKSRIQFFLFFILLIIISFHLSANVPLTSAEMSMDEKQQYAVKIFNKLKATKGIHADESPFLRVTRNLPNPNFKMAMVIGSTGAVYLEEACFDLCIDEMGKDAGAALAFVLAHEIGHITHQHGITHNYIDQFEAEKNTVVAFSGVTDKLTNNQRLKDSITQVFEQISRKYNIMQNEAEADLEAGFMSYLAGYDVMEAGQKFLDLAYDKFDIKEEGGNYATKAERKEIIQKTGARLDTLISVFELGNYATIIGEEELAMECFDLVTKDFKSKKLYNNIGVQGILAISGHLSMDQVPYVLPLTLEINLFSIDGDTDKDIEEQRREAEMLFNKRMDILNRAISNFNKAIELDRHYTVAYLNKSIAYYLMYVLKNQHLGIEKRMPDEILFAESNAMHGVESELIHNDTLSQLLSDCYLQLAILSEVRSDKQSSAAFLAKSKKAKADNPIIAINEKIFSGDSFGAIDDIINSQTSAFTECSSDELIANKTKMSEYKLPEGELWTLDIRLKKKKKRTDLFPIIDHFVMKEEGGYKFYEYTKMKGKTRTLNKVNFFVTTPSYTHPTACDIEKGSDLDDLELEYGTPSKILKTPRGSIYRFKSNSDSMINNLLIESGILFIINAKNEVSGWVAFEKTTPL